MPGFKMALGGAARPATGGRGRTGPASQIACFQEEDTAKRKPPGLDLPAATPSAATQVASAAEADSLDAFMAGITDEVTKPKPGGADANGGAEERPQSDKPKAAWEELQEEDPVASYCEAYEQQSKRRKKAAPEAADGQAEGSDGSNDEAEGEGAGEDEEADRRRKPIEPLPSVDHTQVEYEAVRMEFYTPHPQVAKITSDGVKALRAELKIEVTGSDCPCPVVSFGHFGLPEELMEGIRRHGYVKPTPIQSQAIPVGLSGRDIIGIAETGSGKTVAFLTPMLVHCADQPPLQKDEGPLGLVLAPTRELAVQIEREVYKFNKIFGLRSTTLAGGLSKYQQFKEIKKGSEIVIATPGRLIDIVKMKGCTMRRCTLLVLDEADRMLSMGFEAQIRSIVQNLRPSRQSLLFSATLPPKIERMALDLLRNPIRITVGRAGQAAENVTQHVEVLPKDGDKWAWLAGRVSRMLSQGQLLVFVQTKQATDELQRNFTELLRKSAAVLHGDLSQDERMHILDTFRKQKTEVLIATDLAARGLDVPSIGTVVSYDVARDIETHTHRVGRTGRAGGKGEAYTLLTAEKGKRMAVCLAEHLESMGQPVGEELLRLASKHPMFRASRQAAEQRSAAGRESLGGAAGQAPPAGGGSAEVVGQAQASKGCAAERGRSRSRSRSASASAPPTPPGSPQDGTPEPAEAEAAKPAKAAEASQPV